ncbi:MAG: DNA cytosine methyltransferase [Pseudomonadota bacterium]
MNASVVDLFCGVGGLTYGFRREGFKVVAGVDSDSRCAYPFEHNTRAKFIARDVAKLSSRELLSFYPKNAVRILAGCAPCQPFSLYRNGKSREGDWTLLREFARLAKSTRPEVVTMENVPQLVHHEIFDQFVDELEQAGYWTSWYLPKSHTYGVPQRRIRLVLFASRFGAIELLAPTHLNDIRTVRDAIGNLPPIAAGHASRIDRLHRSRNLTEINTQRIQATREGGWWKDWDDSLVLKCHKKPGGRSYRTVYGRMDWDRPSPTITTQCIGLGNGQFGHPDQDRAISLREAALLQTFPRKYRFVDPREPISMQRVALHIGNAVPVRLARIIGRSIKNHLKMVNACPT